MITDVFLFVFERSVSASLAVIFLVMFAPFLNRRLEGNGYVLCLPDGEWKQTE